jgi:hypothetical protein
MEWLGAARGARRGRRSAGYCDREPLKTGLTKRNDGRGFCSNRVAAVNDWSLSGSVCLRCGVSTRVALRLGESRM